MRQRDRDRGTGTERDRDGQGLWDRARWSKREQGTGTD